MTSSVTLPLTRVADAQGRLKAMQMLQNDVGRSVDEALRLLDAYQYVAEHGVVCPADWKPGAATMVADPDKSLEYFSSADASKGDDDFGQTLEAITSEKHYQEVIASGGPIVVRSFMSFVITSRRAAIPSSGLTTRRSYILRQDAHQTTSNVGTSETVKCRGNVCINGYRNVFYLCESMRLPCVI
jgi:hypothetical protein